MRLYIWNDPEEVSIWKMTWVNPEEASIWKMTWALSRWRPYIGKVPDVASYLENRGACI